jgi:hypothetical protein
MAELVLLLALGTLGPVTGAVSMTRPYPCAPLCAPCVQKPALPALVSRPRDRCDGSCHAGSRPRPPTVPIHLGTVRRGVPGPMRYCQRTLPVILPDRNRSFSLRSLALHPSSQPSPVRGRKPRCVRSFRRQEVSQALQRKGTSVKCLCWKRHGLRLVLKSVRYLNTCVFL